MNWPYPAVLKCVVGWTTEKTTSTILRNVHGQARNTVIAEANSRHIGENYGKAGHY